MAVSDCSRTCKACGQAFVRTAKGQSTKYCAHCTTGRPCGWCGTVMTLRSSLAAKQECCSRHCANKLRAQRDGRRTDTRVTFVCAGCHTEVTRETMKTKDAASFCSRRCAFLNKTFVASEREAIRRIGKRIRESAHRKQMAEAQSRRAEARAAYLAAAIMRTCIDCGVVFRQRSHIGLPEKRCSACAEDRARSFAKVSRRITEARRRAVERGAGADRIDPLRVFQRDGWRCHICRKKLKPADRGTIKPCAPELEHIVPLAAGGTHTWGNVACACRKCNSEKGTNAFGQLGLQIAA